MNKTSPIYKTRFYSDCIGVFQGGGCRAAAFAGAYDAAFSLGVRFSEVAGTSAGSIVAALLAAGADREFLLAKLKQLKFPSLLVKPTRSTFSTGSKLASALQYVPYKGEMLDSIVNIARLGGLHSSEGIAEWMETCLKELTGKQKGPVLFGELPMPLHVVAGDLSTLKPRIWSTRSTPTESVSHAVRASCTIPMFFQPVEEGSTLLVDGGLVSNVPHFLFSGERAQQGLGSKRVLLFMLEASDARKKADDAMELVLQLVSLAIEGATDVQLTFTPNVAKIVIPTGDIRATDFNSMDDAKVATLISNGRNAAERFITAELLSTQTTSPRSVTISDEHESYLTVTEQLYSTGSIVRVSMPDTRWFWDLFPSVLHWRKSGIRIVSYLPPIVVSSQDAAKENQRRGFMFGMGVEIIEDSSLPFHGMLFDPVTSSGAGALTLPRERSDYEPAGSFYSGRIDQAVVAALHERLPSLGLPADNSHHKPRLDPADKAVLLKLLSENVQFYRQPGVKLDIEEVEISKVLLISRYVRAFRYKQIQSLVDHYYERGLSLFSPAQIPMHGTEASLVTPPVVEETDGKYVALEGNTRFLFCYNNEIPKVQAVVVRGVKAELPGKPVPLQHVKITTIKHPPSERMVGYNHGLFRDIERAVRPLPTN